MLLSDWSNWRLPLGLRLPQVQGGSGNLVCSGWHGAVQLGPLPVFSVWNFLSELTPSCSLPPFFPGARQKSFFNYTAVAWPLRILLLFLSASSEDELFSLQSHPAFGCVWAWKVNFSPCAIRPQMPVVNVYHLEVSLKVVFKKNISSLLKCPPTENE